METQPTTEGEKNIDVLEITLLRETIQGGLNNDEFGDNIEDWRLQHHYPTEYVKSWKDYDTAGRDSKYTDLCSKF